MGEKELIHGIKVPSAENGIRIHRGVCGICGFGCNLDAYVRDGEVIKVTGCKNPAYGNGFLCARGHANRPYIYHKDRITTPLRRKGQRGEGEFEPISWEEALDEIAKRLGECKKKYDASAVVFTGGRNDWNRAALQRLSRSFGSVNYASPSFSGKKCSAVIASGVAAGCTCRPDLHHSGVVLMWGCNIYSKGNTVVDPVLTQKRGAKVIAIDPRTTISTYRLADLHLQVRPGTDAALAHGLARLFIENGWVNKSYIEQHVLGFFDYRAYINDFTPEYVEQLTGVPAGQLEAAAHMIMRNGPMSVMISEGAFAEMRNGVQTRRAIEALCAVTGNYDVRGGMLPEQPGIRERVLRDFVTEIPLETQHFPVGIQRYPLFARFSDQCQLSDLARQIRKTTPYPIRALCSFGLNIHEFANDAGWAEALRSLDFFVDVDLFLTSTARYADIVLPACSTFEREVIRVTEDHRIYDTRPIIAPLGEARSDLDIISALARKLTPEDRLLGSGAESLYAYWLAQMGLSLDILRYAEEPLHLPEEVLHPGDYTAEGYRTPSGLYELKSQVMTKMGEKALPEYREPRSQEECADYPFVLSVGNRRTFGVRSKTRRLAWIRAMQGSPMVAIHPDDARILRIMQGDTVEISTHFGAVRMEAYLARSVQRGMVTVLPDDEEADIFAILPEDVVDPASGVVAFRGMSCSICKV